MNTIVLLLALLCLFIPPHSVTGTNVWMDIISCVHNLANTTNTDNTSTSSSTPVNVTPSSNATSNSTVEQTPDSDFSMMKLFSVICGDKDGFVQCLDTSLKHSSDPVAQVIGSLFDPKMVTQAYAGLCANISAIEEGGVDVMSCLSKVKMTSCQNEMADYFFYMGVVKKFAPASEQLSKTTMETLLCSVTFQRRQCEVRRLRQCSRSLADVMAEFYRQTQPDACAQMERKDNLNRDNRVQH